MPVVVTTVAPCSRARSPGSLEQRRLTDSRLATDNEGATMPGNLIDHSEEALQFLVAPYKRPPGAPSASGSAPATPTLILPLGDDSRCAAIARAITGMAEHVPSSGEPGGRRRHRQAALLI